MQYYIATGQMPPKLWTRLQQEGAEFFADPLKSLSKDELRLFVDWMISCSFLEPEVSMARKPGCMYIGDLSDDDKGEVVNTLGLSLKG